MRLLLELLALVAAVPSTTGTLPQRPRAEHTPVVETAPPRAASTARGPSALCAVRRVGS